VTWEAAWNSTQDMTPKNYAWGPVELPPEVLEIAMPGRTKLV